jgi:peptide-methionine (S)-S-oxide reductase
MAASESIVLGGGCFWCTEAVYQRVKGVEEVTPGYAGGRLPNPSYEQVTGGDTGHAEVIKVTFDPVQISLAQILEIFWTVHDPTQLNRQGADVGTQYRSIIFYASDEQKETIERSLAEVAKPVWGEKIVTSFEPLTVFYPAEEYHRNYFRSHPEQAYCQIVINPKLEKLQEKFGQLTK